MKKRNIINYQILGKLLLVSLFLTIVFSFTYYKIKPIAVSQTQDINDNFFDVNDKNEILLFNEPLNETIGYIEFVNFKQTNPIALGTNDDILNTDVVGLHYLSENLDKENNEIILAAHNKKSLFNILLKLKVEDIVKVNSFQNSYIFKVKKIEKYMKSALMEFNPPKKGRVLKLITCIENNEKRLVLTLHEIVNE